jgi:hypothetical protein
LAVSPKITAVRSEKCSKHFFLHKNAIFAENRKNSDLNIDPWDRCYDFKKIFSGKMATKSAFLGQTTAN